MPRVLITRAPHQSSALADHLRALGADPILIPTIALADPTTFEPLDQAVQNLDQFHWLLFTSANAVEAFAKRRSSDRNTRQGQLKQHEITLKIAAIGPSTALAIEQFFGTKPTLIPPQAVAESLAKALIPHVIQPDGTPTRFLLVRAEAARDHLPDTLRAAGAHVTITPAYRTIIPTDSVTQLQTLFADPSTYPDAITFTSSSTAQNLFTLLDFAGLTLPPAILRASIGPITSQTLRDLGYPPHLEAPEATVASLAESLAKGLGLSKSQ